LQIFCQIYFSLQKKRNLSIQVENKFYLYKMTWLLNKKIVVIGGTTGMGLSAALAFVREGAQVIVVGRDPESCKKAELLLKSNGKALNGDAIHEKTAQQAIDLCINMYGDFNGLYHVAGGSGRKYGDGPLHELTLEGWNKTFELNLTSLMLSNQAAVKTFLSRNTEGPILNMGSVLGSSPSTTYFTTHAYAASKAAVTGFIKATAAYYAKNNIRINGLYPALVETPMAQRAAQDDKIMGFIKTKQPLDGGRIGVPEDLDGAAVYFMSDYAKFTTGQILMVDGGWTISEGQII
jgi:NAD(P)-dependent dehydrogenase (short-subunit alcohol dehydrogenase family)